MFTTLKRLLDKGIRCSTLIDIGCADGHFTCAAMERGMLADAVPMNIDANPLYEGSLKAIAEVVGGHYFIGAITDHEGEVELFTGAHHYWASALPEDDKYWRSQYGEHGEKIKVPAATLDALSRRFALKPPFILKLDVQGLEVQVLKGANEVLTQTEAVICEAGIHEFHAIDRCLVERGFVLYDAIAPLRHADGTLLQFYPVYIPQGLRETVTPANPWEAERQEAVIQVQRKRREAILMGNQIFLERRRKEAKP